MDEFEVSRRRFVTGAGAASVGLTVALLPSAVAAASAGGGPPTTVDPVSGASAGQAFMGQPPGGTGTNSVGMRWVVDGVNITFDYVITGPFDNSPREGSITGLGTVGLSGWTLGEEITVVLTATIDGVLTTYSRTFPFLATN